ncbi:Zinc finger protein 629 [Eumeta japonica]|uniref:Zinc finger protein 629 n=1 Tax=Eumeta variegata TaxID=151549 RepID=A0A4C1XTA8_EUMVA|nr:Zinc finger protein 629 [Eumeta japonica]
MGNRHLLTFTVVGPMHIELESNDKNVATDGEPLHRHGCPVCKNQFVSAEILAAHKCSKRRRRKRKVCSEGVANAPTEKDIVKRRKGRRGEPTSDPQVVTCDECQQSFTSKVRLKFHMQFHEPGKRAAEGRYVCGACGAGSAASFATETEFFDHVHFQHGKRKRWQCPVEGCSKTFFLRSRPRLYCHRATLTKHSRTHSDTRRYVCTSCGKRFLDKQTLDEHSVTHLQDLITELEVWKLHHQTLKVNRGQITFQGNFNKPKYD